MKHTKLTLLFIIMTVMACGKNDDKNNTNTTVGPNGEILADGTPGENTDPGDETVVLHDIFDSKANKLMAQVPLPANWRIPTSGSSLYEGPNGTSVYFLPMKMFVHTTDQQMLQIYQQSGTKTRPFISIENLIQQDILPIAQKEGSKLIKQYMVPEVAAANEAMDQMMYKAMPSQHVFKSMVTEWLDAKGKKYAMITHQHGTLSGNFTTWTYYSHALDVPNGDFEKAKNTLIYALANTKYNPRYFDEYNRKEAQTSSASWAAHNAKMQQNQRNFDSWQKNHAQKTAAINDASMAAYRSRDAASDRNHNRFVNYIKDENTVTQASTGQRYQVETGANQYWINDNGEYVKSNDPNYDPNRDQNINNQTWEQTEITD